MKMVKNLLLIYEAEANPGQFIAIQTFNAIRETLRHRAGHGYTTIGSGVLGLISRRAERGVRWPNTPLTQQLASR